MPTSRFRSSFAPLVLPLVGCAVAPHGIESTRPRHVVVLPGIFGARLDSGGTRRFCRQIEREMPEVSAQVWDWTAVEWRFTLVGVANLTDYERNRRRAARLAREIQEWRVRNPGAALYLVGLSGGAGIALLACEALPADVEVEAVVLVSGAVSPTYDLSAALTRTRRGIYNYYSSEDDTLLSTATTKLGTIDRVFGPAAGHCGLASQDAHVLQLAWTPDMRALGNPGGHSDGLGRRFAQKYLLPLFDDDPAKIPDDWK